MDELKTILGENIPVETRGILYLYLLDYKKHELNAINEILFNHPGQALNAYANIPNPESQLAYGNTFDEMIKENERVKKNIRNIEWVKQLEECV